MAKRLSNRERIDRRAEEAAVKAGEKTAKKKTAKKKTSRKKSAKKAAPAQRMKVVWKVFDGNFKEVACFPYPQKEAAEAKAAELTKKKGKDFFVNSAKVPMATDE